MVLLLASEMSIVSTDIEDILWSAWIQHHLNISKKRYVFAWFDDCLLIFRQQNCAKVMFLQASVILLMGGCLSQCMLGYPHPPGADHLLGADNPQEQTPPRNRQPPEQTTPRSRHPLGADTPREQRPPEQTPPGADTPRSRPPGNRPPWSRPPWEQTAPRSRHPSKSRHPPRADPPGANPPQKADSCIRSMSGQYASYWDAFLFETKKPHKNLATKIRCD